MIPVFTQLDSIPVELLSGCVAIGNFDGVHRGHARLLGCLVEQAKTQQGPAVVLTFDPPPMALLRPDIRLQPPITPIPRRAELLGMLGVHAVIALPTSPELLNLTPKQFFDEVLVQQLRVRGIVEGPNFRFGKDREGDTNLLKQLCEREGITVQIVDAENDSGGMVSSSRIRSLLAEGEVESANAMLTQPFQMVGLVTEGAGRGRQLLVPTANLSNVASLIPRHGVYGGVVRVDGQVVKAAVNIGPNPTFGELQSKIEMHLIGWQGDLYGRHLACDLLTWVRETQKFHSKEELLKQIQTDIAIINQRLPTLG